MKRVTEELERERRARIAAEAEAESSLRVLHQRQREAELMRAVATAANEATTVEMLLGCVVGSVCGHLGWRVGHAWLHVESDASMRSSGVWHGEPSCDISALRAATEEMCCGIGYGIAGRVLATRRSEWMRDATCEPTFKRGIGRPHLGVKAVFAFPALAGERVMAVLELFSTEAREPDLRTIDLPGEIGAQLGVVMARLDA